MRLGMSYAIWTCRCRVGQATALGVARAKLPAQSPLTTNPLSVAIAQIRDWGACLEITRKSAVMIASSA